MSGPWRLHANESVDGLSPADVDAVLPALRAGHRYPDARPARLTAAIAAHVGLRPEQVVCGPGSGALCLSLCLAGRLAGRERVVVADPSFDGYRKVAGMAGLPVTAVPLAGDHLDLAGFAGELAGGPDAIVFLPNPNNPTSTVLGRDRIAGFLDAVGERHLVVADEAYLDFDAHADRHTCLPLLDRYPGLVVLRTASKAGGMAGARLGYCLAPVPVARAIDGCVVDYAVPGWVETLALRRIGSAGVSDRVARTRRDREWLTGRLRGLGFAVPASSANFVWLPLGSGADAVAGQVRDGGVLVKVYPGRGLRVSVGERPALETFLSLLAAARLSPTNAGSPPDGT